MPGTIPEDARDSLKRIDPGAQDQNLSEPEVSPETGLQNLQPTEPTTKQRQTDKQKWHCYNIYIEKQNSGNTKNS